LQASVQVMKQVAPMTRLLVFAVANHEPQTRRRLVTLSERAPANGHDDLDTAGGIVRFGFEKSSGTTDFAGGIARFTLESREK
jgi:hypothetical protein